MKLFRVGYGKYAFYTAAETGEEAVKKIQEREHLEYMPIQVLDEIAEVDGYKVTLAAAKGVEQIEEVEAEIEPVEEKKTVKKGTKTKVGD
jgi:hypothetical protein